MAASSEAGGVGLSALLPISNWGRRIQMRTTLIPDPIRSIFDGILDDQLSPCWPWSCIAASTTFGFVVEGDNGEAVHMGPSLLMTKFMAVFVILSTPMPMLPLTSRTATRSSPERQRETCP
jgi:hypothetical protein